RATRNVNTCPALRSDFSSVESSLRTTLFSVTTGDLKMSQTPNLLICLRPPLQQTQPGALISPHPREAQPATLHRAGLLLRPAPRPRQLLSSASSPLA